MGIGLLPAPKFSVELHSGRIPFLKSDVDTLISGCPSAPYDSITYRSGPVAACLFFHYLQPAIDATVFFWSCRLDGSHRLTPNLRHDFPMPFGDLSERLSALFSARISDLLEGEAVTRWRKRFKALMEEIGRVSERLASKNSLKEFIDLGKRASGLEAERELLKKRMEEFGAAMYCILEHLHGPQGKVCKDGIFGFGEAGSDWSQIQHLMARECRRLDEGLPIYGHRREILQQVQSDQVQL